MKLVIVAACVSWAGSVDFVRDVQPIFKEHCYSCHGPIERPKGQLRLDARSALMGSVIVPGNGKGSRLFEVLVAPDDVDRMPRKAPPLPREKAELVRRWIDEGAPWPDSASVDVRAETHWAYVRPRRPEVPRVRKAGWVRNPIDAFVLRRLEEEGLSASPEASRETLIRRVSLDLVGLPPAPKDVQAFLDDTSTNAYEKVVDRLLSSPHYGERWARPWLDLARYADTNGYGPDTRRKVWPYRDWVIAAFNRDMPFSEFTLEQIAGDMLPGATLAQKIATGFHRNTMLDEEDGVDKEEARWSAIVDRVNTTAAVWLGTTLACAQCHNHKYDPLTQRDYYRFFAFFDNTEYSISGKTPVSQRLYEPTIELPSYEPGDALTAWVMKERLSYERPATHVRLRGSFLNKGERVYADVPAVFPRLPEDVLPNRLGLARWLASEGNPLVARTTVNRWWAEIFGRGIVETTDDFGSQGARPTHPELLDWLATELPRRGWSMKAIHRLIVSSATYRQSARMTPAALERDPHNTLLARGPRFRVEAEMIRDAALASSGLLSPEIGGRSVFPDQPEGVWFTPHDQEGWTVSSGRDRYRRGLYTFWKRTAPYPAFATFDAPSRELCAVRRTRTNTPIQSLVLLNDPAFFEAARGLARRMLREAGPGPRERAAHGFRLVLTRAPAPRELDRIVSFYLSERAGGAAETAAWTLVANVLLNLDEAITKE